MNRTFAAAAVVFWSAGVAGAAVVAEVDLTTDSATKDALFMDYQGKVSPVAGGVATTGGSNYTYIYTNGGPAGSVLVGGPNTVVSVTVKALTGSSPDTYQGIGLAFGGVQVWMYVNAWSGAEQTFAGTGAPTNSNGSNQGNVLNEWTGGVLPGGNEVTLAATFTNNGTTLLGDFSFTDGTVTRNYMGLDFTAAGLAGGEAGFKAYTGSSNTLTYFKLEQTAVPEPAAIAAGGVAALGLLRRRRA